jgi:hypothetical protein
MCILFIFFIVLGKGCWSDSGHNLEANATIRGGTVLCLEQSRKSQKRLHFVYILHCLGKGCWSDSGHNLEANATIRGGAVLCFEQC